jgi:hypothetical protein
VERYNCRNVVVVTVIIGNNVVHDCHAHG